MNTPKFDEVQVGDALPGQTFQVTRADLVRYCGASGDFNTIHWSERIAREVGLPGVIAHGMFTMATAVRVVTDWCGDPGAIVQYGVRFTKPVPVDDERGATLEVSAVVATKDEAARTVRVDLTATTPGADGASVGVLGRARAVVRLP
jgi:acyl dehydratase